MSVWELLGISATKDIRSIKKAYAEKVKTCHPEDDPDGFRLLQEAYRQAMDYARGKEAEEVQVKEEPAIEQEKKAQEIQVEEVKRQKRSDQLFNEVHSSMDSSNRIEVIRHLLKDVPCVNEEKIHQLMQNDIMRMYLDDPIVVSEADNYLSALPVKGNVADIKKFYAMLEAYHLPLTKAKVEKNIRIKLDSNDCGSCFVNCGNSKGVCIIMREVAERDWKVFRKKVPEWQEAYMEKLIGEYIALLQDETKSAGKKFWELNDRIYVDENRPGVVLEMKRSRFYSNLVSLLRDHVIEKEDLEEFSDEVKEAVELMMW